MKAVCARSLSLVVRSGIVLLGEPCPSGHQQCLTFPEDSLQPCLHVPLPIRWPLLGRTVVLSFQSWSVSCFEAGVIFFLFVSLSLRLEALRGAVGPMGSEPGPAAARRAGRSAHLGWGGGRGPEPPPALTDCCPPSQLSSPSLPAKGPPGISLPRGISDSGARADVVVGFAPTFSQSLPRSCACDPELSLHRSLWVFHVLCSTLFLFPGKEGSVPCVSLHLSFGDSAMAGFDVPHKVPSAVGAQRCHLTGTASPA